MFSTATIRHAAWPKLFLKNADYQDQSSASEAGDTAQAAIVAGCQQGNPVMQRELYNRSHQQLFRLAARMVGRQDAADVCQQIFLKVFESINNFTGRSQLTTWMYRIAVNECLQFRRKRNHRPSVQLGEYEPPDRAKLLNERTPDRELLEIALSRIDPELRCIFHLREKDEMSYAEISGVLRLAPGTVASRLNRAREQLQEILIALNN